MQIAEKLVLRKDASLADIEQLMIELTQCTSTDHIELHLPRRTQSQILSDVWLTRVIATLAARNGTFSIHDYGDTWKNENVSERFLERVDGVAVLLHCDGSRGMLLNAREEPAPQSLRGRLLSRIEKTARLESVSLGPVATYIAIDPISSVPIELNTRTDDGLQLFRRLLTSILRDQFGEVQPTLLRGGYENRVYDVVYELFQNSYEHGCRDAADDLIAGLRYLRFRTIIGNNIDELVRRSSGSRPLQSYFFRRANRRGPARFLEISVGDEGMGILEHYLATAAARERHKDRHQLVNDIFTKNLSSKQIHGAGLGLPNALNAMRALDAFVMLRTNELWLYRDYSDPSWKEPQEMAGIRDVAIAWVRGTQYSIILDFQVA